MNTIAMSKINEQVKKFIAFAEKESLKAAADGRFKISLPPASRKWKATQLLSEYFRKKGFSFVYSEEMYNIYWEHVD